MQAKITELLELVKKLPEDCVEDTIKYIKERIGENDKNKSAPPCPSCNSDSVNRFGQRRGKKRYICKACGKTFIDKINTVMYHSHFGEAVWKQVINDTISGTPLSDTAASLVMSESTAFRMRHKVLMALEANENSSPTVLNGVCELDETYVLESYKGTKLPEDFWRGPRMHGAKAKKSGVSKEYVGICTGVQREGKAISQSVTRSVPGKDDVISVFGKSIKPDSIIMYDGLKSYIALGKECQCPVKDVFDEGTVQEDEKGFYNINTVNGFHSLIKERYRSYRGVATKYLNRYNVLFSKLYDSPDGLVDGIYNMLMARDENNSHSVHDVKTLNLLDL